jgi:uroporphyrinogen-III decarboxylase
MIDYEKITPSRQPEGSFPWMLQQPPRPLFPDNRPITARENLLRVFKGEKPSWIPVWLVDNQYCWPDIYVEHAPFEGDGYDWWGQHWTYVKQVDGGMPTPGYRVISDITKWKEEVRRPNFKGIPWEADAAIQTARYDPDKAHVFHVTEGNFERLHEMMPMDETMIAMYEEPELVKDFFAMMQQYKIDLIDIVFEKYAPIDYIIYGDDWGTQRSGFFSNEMFREFIMPYTKPIWDFAHSKGKFVELHSCGLTQQYINEFVEMGLDAWSPQPINDFDMLTRDYGEKIAITVPIDGIGVTKDPKEARELVRKWVDKFAPRGKLVAGAIFNPDQEVTKAALEELYNYSSEFYAKR